ncbi:MAG TPA: hypothetical protein VM364_05090 [Vicinamibacterales bacterium]|nr:hypothetical protein [Vicinamibacterales bacterium]
MRRLFALAGIDAAQWAALTRTYLVMDLRRSGGPKPAGSRGDSASALPLAGLLIGAFMNSIVIALLVFLVRDTLTAAAGMVAMAGMTISMLLLVDFAGSVVSAEDYWVVAPRPVTSRTYFAARLAAVLVYVAAFAVLMSIVPAFVFTIRHGLGAGAFVGAIVATVASGLAGTGLVIGVYTRLIARVPPDRLVRVMSAVHLAASGLSMAGFLVVMKGFEDARIRDFSIGDLGWIWYVPATWYAAIVPAFAGAGGAREVTAALAALVVTAAVLGGAAGRISLEFALRLSEAKTATRPRGRQRALVRIPGFGSGEAYAVATLVRAQFRYDLRFRLGILGVLPMTLFYLFLGWDEGVLVDPFTGSAKGGAPIYMAVAFLPMILHSALQSSDHWRASWIFLATPADPARLLVAAKNFVAVFVLGTYLLLMAAFWAVFYDRVWHAVVHALIVGAGAHILLQGAVILSPQLPFAKEPQRAEQSARLFMLFFFGIMFVTLAPMLLPFIYARPPLTIALVVLLAGATALLEWGLHRRARAYFAELEFT